MAKTPLDLVEPRKPIQICATGADQDDYGMLFALCDDGSIWSTMVMANGDVYWNRVTSIPQHDKKAGEIYD